MIRKATLKDLDAILKITKSCAEEMISKNIFQWNDSYPNRKAFENDIHNGWLYVREEKRKIIGSICVSDFMDEEYLAVRWLSTNNNNIYIHRLAVDPTSQCQGFGQDNISNQRFYKQRGYKRLGSIFFPNQSKEPFYCYELIL
jgi:ribosomal protein S18 acetylase RimI-like enzyme